MCTLEKRGNVYVLTLTGPGEHRFNPTLIDAIQSALHRVKSDPTSSSSSALITTAEGKFFSNGYDIAWVKSNSQSQSIQSKSKLLSRKLRSLISDFISLPMPTIAAVTGHATAAALILALSHDYIFMRKDRGFLYMSELDLGLDVPAWFMGVIKCKVSDPRTRRDLVLASAKMTAKEAMERGIIDSAHDNAEETIRAAVEFGEDLVKMKYEGEGYARNRMVIFGEALDEFVFDETVGEARSVSKL